MPTNPKLNENDTRKMYDKDVVRFAKRIAAAYSSDKIRLVASRSARRAVLLHDIDAINDIIRDIPNMPSGLRTDFCDAFIGEDMSGLDLATPAILGYAYRAISARAKEGEKGQQERLDKIAARIDDLSADFANSGGMVVRQHEWPLINITNIANENEDFSIMLDARMADVDDEKKAEMAANKQQADTRAKDYDEAWNLNNIKPEDVDKLSERWDEIYRVLYHNTNIWDTVLEKFAKCKMLDSKGNVIPQFRGGRGDPEEHEEYKPGFRILDDSRFASIVELVDHDIAKRYVADVNAKIDKKAIESELNETLLIKLYEIYAADQVTNGAFENPEQFADPEMRDKFMQMLEPDGEGIEISDRGYNVAIETQTDATVGWGARLRNKIGGTSKNLERFWKKVNRPLDYIDDMADVRMSRAAVARRKKRRSLAGRVIVGFGSSFIASALITVIATAAAAKWGLSLASGLAWVGGGATLAIMGFQIARWIINQKKNNLPVTWEEFKKNGQLLRSLGTSGLAIIAMVLGVKGLADAAMGVGIGALALGMYNNARGISQVVQDSKMSQRQKIAWAIASVASVILGALGGRLGAQWGIGKYNQWNPDNTLFRNKELIPTGKEKISDEVTATKTTTHYPDDAVPRAEKAVTDWYQEKYPNDWEQHLAQDIRAVEQYNADTGSDMNPYRALRAIRMTDPERFAYTDAWRGANNVTADQVNALANAIGPDGTYNLEGMNEASNLDLNHLGVKGEIGDNIPGHKMRSGDLYRSIEKLPTQTTEEIVVEPAVYKDTFEPHYTPVHGDGVAMFGNYTPRERRSELRDRLGSFVDRVRHGLRPGKLSKDETPARESEPEDMLFVPPVKPEESEVISEIKEEPREEDLSIFTPGDTSEETNEDSSPVITDEPKNEKLPPWHDGDIPAISPERVLREPTLDTSGGALRRLREIYAQKHQNPGKAPIALLTPEKTHFESLPASSFAMTAEQAEHWEDLHKQLAKVRATRKNTRVHASEFMKLLKQEKSIEKEINSFYERLGRPSTMELEQALAEVQRRRKLQQFISELNRHIQRKPTGDAEDWRVMKWVNERNKILQKIKEYGGEDSLDDSGLRFAAPTDVERRQKMLDENLKDASVINRGFKIRSGKSVNVDLLPDTGIGVPITLFRYADLQTPLMRNGNQIAVVADIDGIRVPFVLADDDSNTNKVPGNWYPMLGLDSTIGQPLFRDWGVMSSETVKEFFEKIGKELDTRFGDVRKDINKIPAFNKEVFFHIMGNEGNTYKKYFVWGPMGRGHLFSVNDMRKYLDGLREIYHQDNLRPGERFLRGIGQVVTGARERGLFPNRRLFKRYRE